MNGLGLRLSEAKVFSALSELGVSKADTISIRSGVAREYVYQLLSSLVKKGFVEVIIAIPKKFKAIPLRDAYKILLQRKKEENRKLYLKAMKALKSRKYRPKLMGAPKSQMSLVPSRNPPDARIGQEYLNTEKSVDLIFPVGKYRAISSIK